MTREEVISKLKVEIERTGTRTERACGALLKCIAEVLLSTADGHTTLVTCEQCCSTGRVDIVVLFDSMLPGGRTRREAHVWELKAPQLPLFEARTKSQVHPSKELYSAETQLMHYCYSLANNGTLLRRWEVLSPDHVGLGGIIMGRDSNLVDCKDQNQELALRLAREAYEIREVYFYKRAIMELWTWDKVIRVAEHQTASHQQVLGDPNKTIDLKDSIQFTATSPNEHR